MSIQSALDYIKLIRGEPAGQADVEAPSAVADLDSLVALAAQGGFQFTAQELARAHELDWEMRARIYLSDTAETSTSDDAQT